VAATPSASRPWWRRLLGGIVPARTPPAGGQPGADDRDGEGEQAAADGDAAGSGGEPAGPVGVLVSADRYDLSES
jgi:hypothetical protein